MSFLYWIPFQYYYLAFQRFEAIYLNQMENRANEEMGCVCGYLSKVWWFSRAQGMTEEQYGY